jgi:multiple antibiotic resistance protein
VPEVPLQKLFVLLFMMTGPLRVVPGFAALSRTLDAPSRDRLALRGALFAACGVLLAVFMGAGLLKSWGASRESLTIVIGLLLLLTGLQSVIGWPAPPASAPAPEEENPSLTRLALSPLAFPNILPPFGVGVLILFAAYFPDIQNQLKMVGLALALLVVDLVAMRYAQQVLRAIGTHTLQLLGAVFGVAQLALAMEMILWGLKSAFAPR